jgi:hypothetical protein
MAASRRGPQWFFDPVPTMAGGFHIPLWPLEIEIRMGYSFSNPYVSERSPQSRVCALV